jgi:hypothetical protein
MKALRPSCVRLRTAKGKTDRVEKLRLPIKGDAQDPATDVFR